MAELEALLFDVDGTLADTERDGHRVAFNSAFAEAGLDWNWTPELYGRLLEVTGGKERIRHFLSTELPDFRFPGDADTEIANLHERKTHYFTQMLAEGAIPLRPGVERLLREARNMGLRLAVATTTTPANVEALLTHTIGPEAMDWFEVIAAGDVVPNKKPAPDIYVYAMEHLNLAPEACLAFEDSENGVHAVRDAGLRSLIITTNGYTEDHNFNGATVVLDQLGEPGSPCRVLAGDVVPNGGYIDVDIVRLIHAVAWGAE